MQTVLFFISMDRSNYYEHLEGIYRHACKRNWHVQVADVNSGCGKVRDMLAFWKPIGIFVEYGQNRSCIPCRIFGELPVVFFDIGRHKPSGKGVYVGLDSAATGRMGADHLLHLGLRHYAYVGLGTHLCWDVERGKAFSDEIVKNGQAAFSFGLEKKSSVPLSRHRLLCGWLNGLPCPCGILAANDRVAEEVLNALSSIGAAVPDDFAVLGVDNDCPLCENQIPPLSSIETRVSTAGELAAQLLDELITSRTSWKDETKLCYFRPVGVVERASTRRLACDRSKVSAALELIRINAVEGIGVMDVVESMGVSRRAAENHFRLATGRSIHEEIDAVRFAHVYDCLRNRRQSIGSIAGMCGFPSDGALRKAFRLHTGMSMRDWRARHDAQK